MSMVGSKGSHKIAELLALAACAILALTHFAFADHFALKELSDVPQLL